jgi:hypothetical protein
MLGKEELAGHLSPRPHPLCCRQWRVRRAAGHFLELAGSEVWPFQLLLAELGQRMQISGRRLPAMPI